MAVRFSRGAAMADRLLLFVYLIGIGIGLRICDFYRR
jgi:hypothetical protein